MTAERQASEAFVSFLERVVATQPKGGKIHVVCDNLSAHKAKAVAAWLDRHPSAQTHCTPTYSSWLNQVEIWFSKIQRDLTSRGIFTSRTDLRRKIMGYIRMHNRNSCPFFWPYRNTKRRIRVNAS
jgi:transposase